MCVIGRSNVVPAWFARVHPKTSTPVNVSAFLGIFTTAITLLTDLNVLINLMSIETLFVFYMVSNAVIYRRYVATGTTNPWPTLANKRPTKLGSTCYGLNPLEAHTSFAFNSYNRNSTDAVVEE